MRLHKYQILLALCLNASCALSALENRWNSYQSNGIVSFQAAPIHEDRVGSYSDVFLHHSTMTAITDYRTLFRFGITLSLAGPEILPFPWLLIRESQGFPRFYNYIQNIYYRIFDLSVEIPLIKTPVVHLYPLISYTLSDFFPYTQNAMRNATLSAGVSVYYIPYSWIHLSGHGMVGLFTKGSLIGVPAQPDDEKLHPSFIISHPQIIFSISLTIDIYIPRIWMIQGASLGISAAARSNVLFDSPTPAIVQIRTISLSWKILLAQGGPRLVR